MFLILTIYFYMTKYLKLFVYKDTLGCSQFLSCKSSRKNKLSNYECLHQKNINKKNPKKLEGPKCPKTSKNQFEFFYLLYVKVGVREEKTRRLMQIRSDELLRGVRDSESRKKQKYEVTSTKSSNRFLKRRRRLDDNSGRLFLKIQNYDIKKIRS